MFCNALALDRDVQHTGFIAVCFLLGDSQASEFYVPTIRNTLSHFHRWVSMKYNNPGYYSSYLPTYEDGTECSETLAYNIQTQEYQPEENIQQYLKSIYQGNHSEESIQQYLKSIYHESLQTGRLKTIMKF